MLSRLANSEAPPDQRRSPKHPAETDLKVVARNERMRRYYVLNRQKFLRKRAEYVATNYEEVKRKSKERSQRQDVRERRKEREQLTGTGRAYYQKNRVKVLARQRALRKQHPEKVREKGRRYFANNKEKVYARHRSYQATHRHIYQAASITRCKREVSSSTAPERKRIARWISQIKASKKHRHCYWCNKRTHPKNIDIDHIISLSQGGSHALENLCVSCSGCNRRKHAKSVPNWNTRLANPVLVL